MATIPKSKTIAGRIVFAALLMLAVPYLARAGDATLMDYRHRISQALTTIEQLQAGFDDEDQTTLREDSIRAAVARVRDQLPPKETVLVGSQIVTVDNAWLNEALSEYEKVRNNPEQSVVLLTRIGERLRALGERLDEFQKGNAATDDKNKNKSRLAEVLRRTEYDKSAAAEGSALGRLWQRFLDWFSSLFPKTKPTQPGNARAWSGVAQVLVIGICLAGIAFLVWKFAPAYFRNRRKKKKTKPEPRIVLGELLDPDQTSADLLAQAEGLARAGDLRGAIRKAYIAFLCELGDRKIISLAQHKTNRDYLQSVRSRPSLYPSMDRLTNSFELHWYGFVPVRPDDWASFRAGYLKAVRTEK